MYLTAQQPSPGRVGKCAINIGHSFIAGMSSLQITFWREDGEVVSSGRFPEINLSLCTHPPHRNLGGKTVLRHVFSKERELYRFLVFSSERVLKSLRGRDDPSRLDMGIGRNGQQGDQGHAPETGAPMQARHGTHPEGLREEPGTHMWAVNCLKRQKERGERQTLR